MDKIEECKPSIATEPAVPHSVAYSLPKVPERPHERRLSPTVNC
jgi:hypothetical protein